MQAAEIHNMKLKGKQPTKTAANGWQITYIHSNSQSENTFS